MNALAKASVKLHYLFWEVSRIYPVARNFRERFSLLWFFLMFHMCYHVPSFFRGRDATIRIQGAKYIVGLGTEEIGTFKELYCDQIYEMVAEFVPKHGWIVIDIGANVGLFAVQQVQRGAHVIAFEPNRHCYRRLKKTIMANGLNDRVNIFNDAVGSQPGSGQLLVQQVSGLERTTIGTVIPVSEPNAVHGSEVTIVALDQVIPSLGISHIHLLKLDVEGAEVEVLRGATSTLDFVDRILLEYHSQDLLEQVNVLISACGFKKVLQVDLDIEESVGILYAERISAPL